MMFDKRKIARNFSKAAYNYMQQAVLQKMVAERLLERLSFIRIKPKTIIDAGSGVGFAARQLSKMYRLARVIQIDLSFNMLRQSKSMEPRFFSKQRFICADAEQIPLTEGSAELFFSSLMLQWCNDLDETFGQIAATLTRQGLFLFTSFGPDTLKELRASWATVDQATHVNPFVDMHNTGDALVRAGFIEPVIDVEYITMTYQDSAVLMKELKTLGSSNALLDQPAGLTGKNKFNKMIHAYEEYRHEDRLPATYEVIYGHAWTPYQKRVRTGVPEVFIPISSLSRPT